MSVSVCRAVVSIFAKLNLSEANQSNVNIFV